jgi:hypothetical protein
MGRAQLQAGKSVQCALEDQIGEGNDGFERIVDDVGQQAVALEPFGEIRNALGMSVGLSHHAIVRCWERGSLAR